MTYENVLYETDGRVATITMNRPDKLNALSEGLIDDIVAAAEEAEADREVRSIILKAAGRAFSAGYDISPGAHGDGSDDLYTELMRFRKTNMQWGKLWNLSKPIIAQVHGYCLAGATDLATSCDMIIAAENSTFGLPDVRGIESVENHMWTYLVGPQWAKRMMMTGDPIDGKTAERIGLIMQAVPADQLDAEVKRLAGRVANIPLELLAPSQVAHQQGHGPHGARRRPAARLRYCGHHPLLGLPQELHSDGRKRRPKSRPPKPGRPLRRLHRPPQEVTAVRPPSLSPLGNKIPAMQCIAGISAFLPVRRGRSCCRRWNIRKLRPPPAGGSRNMRGGWVCTTGDMGKVSLRGPLGRSC